MPLIAAILELIRRTATDLSTDVEQALSGAGAQEQPGSTAASLIATILDNVRLARADDTPICQDTGAMTFLVDCPPKTDHQPIISAIHEATRQATARQYLRPNAVDPLSGKNSGDNIADEHPLIRFSHWPQAGPTRIRLLLKGGGSENVGQQYRLPEPTLQADRDLEGVYRVVVDAVHRAQGHGCAPGIVAVGIGGDRASSAELAKLQLFRRFGQRHEDARLAGLEKRLIADLNRLGIGPMGLGGRCTVLEVFCGLRPRHPASFFVTINYDCWALRRRTLILEGDRAQYD